MIRFRFFAYAIVTTVLVASVGHAEGNLLWKTTNPLPATVVPAYTNQVSPFPKRAIEEVVSETTVDSTAVSEAIAEQQRLRDEAYSSTEGLISSGRGFEPQLAGLRVGGMLDGLLGARVLLNNQWVGTGSSVSVRRVRTQEMAAALNALKEYDAEAATRLSSELQGALTSNGLVRLTVKKIEPKLLTLTSESGQTYTLPISIDNR